EEASPRHRRRRRRRHGTAVVLLMRILLPTDVFPPDGRGGAAWSSHALARALLARGHQVTALVPVRGRRGVVHADALGVPAVRIGYTAPSLPVVQNYFRHERFWPVLAKAIVAEARRGPLPQVLHAQHVQTAPGAVLAGKQLGVPVVVTVRDHWPWHYFATGLHGDQVPYGRPGWPGLATELPARLGPLRGILALAGLPYMLAHQRRRAQYLARADAVIAVSTYIAERLAGIVQPERLHVLPNMLDMAANETIAAAPPETRWEGGLLLFVGKLEANKGAGLLPAIFRELRAPGMPNVPPFTLVIAGDGALRDRLTTELGTLGLQMQMLNWASHDEVLRLMKQSTLLLFPSTWGEPLSRVLLEASGMGTPILAMPTGGTQDIIHHGITGAIAATPRLFAQRMAELLLDPVARNRLGEGARAFAHTHFAYEAVLPRYERLYQAL
ncbi:glycosyltransferase family 4 protein, partial [Candidatus Chloroploca mongolica]